MRILIVGAGSIGKRHINNLFSLGYTNITIVDIFEPDSSLCKTHYHTIKEAIKNNKYDIAFICTPPYLHISQAIKIAQTGAHLFIEKPLSHNLRGIPELLEICEKNNTLNMVACNFRFHPEIQALKAKIEFEQPIHAQIFSGNYLPNWDNDKHYQETYSAKHSQGGGVHLDKIHEIDLAKWLLGDFETFQQNLLRISDLKINSYDLAQYSILHKNACITNINLNYFQKEPERIIKIFTNDNIFEWDYYKSKIDKNDMYKEQIKYFLECIKNKQQPINSIKEAYNLLKYIKRKKYETQKLSK